MSERGSFVTEYIYCSSCLKEILSIFKDEGKFFHPVQLPSWEEGELLPIIAGKIGGLYQGEELDDFEETYIPRIEKVICHPIRIAVLADRGEKIFILNPRKAK